MQTNQTYLKADVILAYLLNKDDNLDTQITCGGGASSLITSDQSLYEALGAVRPGDNFVSNRLLKFLENVDVVSYRRLFGREKSVLTTGRIDELRCKVLSTSSKKSSRSDAPDGMKELPGPYVSSAIPPAAGFPEAHVTPLFTPPKPPSQGAALSAPSDTCPSVLSSAGQELHKKRKQEACHVKKEDKKGDMEEGNSKNAPGYIPGRWNVKEKDHGI
ncbi:hypothetical protein COY95_01300 [Candidatus Woesearchaeota archaeon CG_4_10_14_0_8_um_filter_47_5]|nr:MAG: hypothetical protein COY95_01300 [Candidatus Woesearchaeota archaeon CG_4_10_14_0_8_um_filter_47_5]